MFSFKVAFNKCSTSITIYWADKLMQASFDSLSSAGRSRAQKLSEEGGEEGESCVLDCAILHLRKLTAAGNSTSRAHQTIHSLFWNGTIYVKKGRTIAMRSAWNVHYFWRVILMFFHMPPIYNSVLLIKANSVLKVRSTICTHISMHTRNIFCMRKSSESSHFI